MRETWEVVKVLCEHEYLNAHHHEIKLNHMGCLWFQTFMHLDWVEWYILPLLLTCTEGVMSHLMLQWFGTIKCLAMDKPAVTLTKMTGTRCKFSFHVANINTKLQSVGDLCLFSSRQGLLLFIFFGEGNMDIAWPTFWEYSCSACCVYECKAT